jgi:hypothetical protein
MKSCTKVIVLSLHVVATKALWFCQPRAERFVRASSSCKPLFVGREEGHYPFVENDSFSDRMSEIDAMGGDPFFLSDDDKNGDAAAEEDDEILEPPSSRLASMGMFAGDGVASVLDTLEERYVTDGKGPMPKEPESQQQRDDDWEWDGVVIEDAHMD